MKISMDELVELARSLDGQSKGKFFSRRKVAQEAFKEEIGVAEPWKKFGLTFGAFKERCGVGETKAERKLLNQSSKHASYDELKEKSKERLSWGTKFAKPENKKRFKTIMISSDHHDFDVDPFAWRMWMLKLKKVQPDVICINGDIFDLYEFSRYTKDPREVRLGERIKKVHGMFAEMRKACPNSQIDLIEGNHEARLMKHLLENSPAMAELLDVVHGMGIRELLGLDKFKVNYVAKADLWAFTESQLKKSVNESDKVYWDTLWVRHEPPRKDNMSLPGCHGHHHKFEAKTHFNPAYGSFQWLQLPGMCKRRASYADGRIWSVGFATAIVDSKARNVSWDITHVTDTGCNIGWAFFERKESERE